MHRAAILILLAPALVSADPPCRTGHCPPPVQLVPAVQFVPTVIQVPTYSISYDPGTSALIDELRGIREELRLMRGGQPQALTVGNIFSSRCASCHAGPVSKASGAGITLLDASGKMPEFSVLEKRAIRAAVISDRMPKGGKPLTADEKKVFDIFK